MVFTKIGSGLCSIFVLSVGKTSIQGLKFSVAMTDFFQLYSKEAMDMYNNILLNLLLCQYYTD